MLLYKLKQCCCSLFEVESTVVVVVYFIGFIIVIFIKTVQNMNRIEMKGL